MEGENPFLRSHITQKRNEITEERLIVQGQGGSTSHEESSFHPPHALEAHQAQIASGDNITISSRNHLMGTITLSHRIDEDLDHKAVQIVNMDEEEEEKSEQPKVHIEASLKVNPNDFVPISVLGKGSFGEVYLVEKNYKELFAMKVLSKQKIMGNNYIKYAMTERNVLSYTHHPFIVKLNYSFQTSKKLFLILDYCPGGDLGKLLAKKGKIDESLARIYIAEIVLAI